VAIFASLIGSGVAFNVFSGGNNPNTPNNSGMEQLFKDIKKMPLPSTQGLAPSKISTLEGGLGWSKIDHTGMQGEFSDFDMIKNFTFAEKVAQNWSTDIQIDSIYIDGVKIDGSLDASAREDWSVDYRFYSPTYRETALAMAKVSEEEPSTELRIKFEAGKMIAHFSHMQLVFLKKRPKKDAFTPTCSTKQLLEEAQKSKKFEAAPFYDLMLQYIDSLPRSSKGYWRWVVGCEGCESTIIMAGSCKLRR